jgi:hypothetical protein
MGLLAIANCQQCRGTSVAIDHDARNRATSPHHH